MIARARAAWPAALAVLLALALALRLPGLLAESLENDEMFTWRVAQGSAGQAWRLIQSDLVHPPLYYYTLRGFTAVLGADELGLRLLSLLCGVALVVGVAVVGRRLLGDWRPALLAAALVAVSDLQIFLSQQARGYTMFGLLVLLLALAFVRALERPEQRGRWVAFGAVAVVTALTHYFGAFYVAATAPVVLLHPVRRRVLGRWLAGCVVAAAALLLWVSTLLPAYRARTGLGVNLNWIEPASLYGLANVYAQFTGAPAFRRATTLSLLIGGALVAVAVLWAWREHRGNGSPERPRVATLLSMAVLPPLAVYALSFPPLRIELLITRYVMPSQLCWLILASMGAFRLGARHRASTVAAAALLLGLQLLPTGAALGEMRRVPYNAAADYIRARRQPGTPGFTLSYYTVGAPVNHYLRRGAERDTLRFVSAVSDSMPASFWLAYRPAQASEAGLVDGFKARGWRVEEERHFADRAGPPLGVRVAWLRR